jgi:hypothetical protein
VGKGDGARKFSGLLLFWSRRKHQISNAQKAADELGYASLGICIYLYVDDRAGAHHLTPIVIAKLSTSRKAEVRKKGNQRTNDENKGSKKDALIQSLRFPPSFHALLFQVPSAPDLF